MNTCFPFLEQMQFRQYRVELRLGKPVRFHYFHGPALNGLLCNALNFHPLGPNIILYPVESGRIDYRKGDMYNFGLTIIGHDPDLAGRIQSRLAERGRTPVVGKTFGSFSVTAFEQCDMAPEPRELPDELTLQFVTPLRMQRQQGTRGRKFFDADYFDIGRLLRLLHDRAYDLCKLSQTDLPPYAVPEIPNIHNTRTSLIWIDAPYHGCSKTFGGVVGMVRFRLESPDAWKHLLWWGQYIHVGRNSAFGLGRYLLNPGSPACLPAQVQPALSVLDRVVKPDNLLEAFYHCKNNHGQAGADGETLTAFEANLFESLEKMTQDLRQGTYRADILFGIILPKSSGKIRALAIPTVKDRILQRAVTQILGPSWDQLMEESSFAYRKGLSRVGAAKAIQKAYNEGFRWFLESDIESFFDNVDWDIMADKVRSLLPSDPIADIIMAWVMQSVVYKDQVLRRTCGLPQGAVVSPLLANLYLDQFDESLGEDFRMVRYADDFVVLCKSKARAEEALEKARKALDPLKLEIKQSKTSIGNFDHGFQYLGYLFCRSMVVESNKENQGSKPVSIADISSEQIPHNHWLTQVDLNGIKSIPSPGEV